MAAIAQSNPYSILSRKIGYSVGLEFLLRNVTALVALYSEKKRLSITDWRAMVERDFGRKGPAYEHMANFFSTLNLIKLIGNEVHPLFGLGVLSILRRYLKVDEAYNRALRVVLSQSLIEADGDIFLNALEASFDREETRLRISAMVKTKWMALRRAFVNPAIQDRIWDLVSIRSQPSSQAQFGESPSNASPFAKRTRPLSAAIRRPESNNQKYVVEVQDSYLDKILPTRKKWAEDLGYFDGSGISQSGLLLIAQLSALGMKTENGAMAFWPYTYDLAPLRIDHHALMATPIESWGVLSGIATANGATVLDDLAFEAELIDLMREVYALYRLGSEARGSIRHQVPIYVMKPAIVGIFVGEQRPIPPLPQFIDKEIRGTSRRFDITNVRGTEGALVFREAVK